MFLFVTGLALLPFSMALTLTFVNPLFVAALAPLLLGEVMDGRRWAAILVGFAGVAVIAWPSGEGLSWAILFPIAGAFVGALRDIATRNMSVTETSASMLFYAAAALTVAGLIGTGGHWRPVDADTGTILALSALAQLVALYLMIEAYRFGEAAVVTPFKYTILVWVVLFAPLIWGDLPAPNVFLGAGIIIASSLYLFDRERHGARIAAPETRI